jgi:hypothetical protein
VILSSSASLSAPTPSRLERYAARPLPPQGAELREIVRIVQRRKWAILIATALGVLIAAVSVLLPPDRYSSTATIELNRESGSAMALGDLAGVAGGLRASQSGFEVVVIPGYAGDCSDNSEEGTWRDTNLGLAGRLRHLVSPKGVPIKEWALFTRRHFGWRWLASTPSPYVKTLLSSALSARPARRPGAARPPGQGSYDA